MGGDFGATPHGPVRYGDAMWLDRFEAPLPLRCRGAFHLYAATQQNDRVVVVVPADPLPSTTASRCLDRLFAAHRSLDGAPTIARARERGDSAGRPFCSFTLDAIADGETLVQRLADTRTRATHAESLTVAAILSAGLAAAHAKRDPTTDAPLCLGAIGWSNVLIASDGTLHWLGFGHNVCVFDESNRLLNGAPLFAAPEVATGAPPTAASDVYAFFLLQQALLPFVKLPLATQRAFAGQADDEPSRAQAAILEWVSQRVLGAPPTTRATIEDVRSVAANERAALGLALCPDAVSARLAALLAPERDDLRTARALPIAMTFADDGSWFRDRDGTRATIDRRPSRRLLLALLHAHQKTPGSALTTDELLEAGWPGERPLREAGLNRIYVALSALRALGLRDLVQRDEQGYRLDPAIAIALEPA